METNRVNFKSGFVSIIGLPNAGKSTLLNSIIKENIAITSRKAQTTRTNLKGIYNDDDSQIVFVDTPGINNGKTLLDDYMKKSILKALVDIDLILVLIDVNSYNDEDYSKIVKLIKNCSIKKLLVVNKCDVYDGDINLAIKEIKDKLLGLDFENVISISALKKKSISELIVLIKENLTEGVPYYDPSDLTDSPTKKIVADMVRQQCLYKLDKEVPHSLDVVVDSMKASKTKCMNIMATIICDKESHKRIIIGKAGSMIKNIGTGARISIEKFLDKKVNLKLNVIVRENWRDELTLLSNYGYDKDNI